jgi:hypothetical protein
MLNGRAKAQGKKPSDFSQVEMERGIKHELEHTKDRLVARQIALDHLADDPNYYTKLKQRMNKADTFVVYKPASVDLLKSEGEDDGRKIGGYCSTEALDRQNEVVFGKGLDFAEFLNFGYFNDNHNQKTSAVLGVPERVRYDIGKGWWTEGRILKTKAGDEIVELAKALTDTKRKLGFSIEGKITERDGNKIRKAIIRNVAITNCPVNVNCTWELLSKAFSDGLDGDDLRRSESYLHNDFVRSLVAGTGPGSTAATGGTGGAVLKMEDLEKDEIKHVYKCSKCDKGFGTEAAFDKHAKVHSDSGSLKITTFDPQELVRTRKGMMTAQEAVRLVKSIHPEWSDLVCLRAARFALLRTIAQEGGE